jgi:hypothetical protein
MSSQSIQLRDWKAVVVGVLVVGAAGYRMVTARTTLDTQGRQALEEWVAGEIRRPLLDEESLSLEEKGQAVLAAGGVRIRSKRAKESLDDLVVRIDLEPGDHLPAGTELVRYYRMEYSTITGWRHRSDASWFAFHTKLF